MSGPAADALARIQEATFSRASAATTSAFPEARRMDGATIEAFLERRAQGVLATVRPDGRPHAAPVGFALVGARIVIASLASAARVRNLRHEPHASLVVEEGDGDARAAVIVEGTARLLEPLEAALELRAPFRDPSGALKSWVETLVVIQPERLLSYAARGFAMQSAGRQTSG